MIGPHEGRELELMLAGRKALAVFHDVLPSGGNIPEEIIPEQAFAPYVASGTFRRFAEEIISPKGDRIRHVCFTLPGHEWRAEFFLWLHREIYAGRIRYEPAHEHIIGGLLGYEKADGEEFLNIKQKRKAVS